MRYCFLVFLGLLVYPLWAQTPKDTTDFSSFAKKLHLKSLVVGRYATSLEDDIDFEGKHFSEEAEAEQEMVTNSFQMEYVRFATTFQINDRISSSILLNLANFNHESVAKKVLENAYVQYQANSYLNIRLGQFRPYFGLEDLHPFQLNNSYRWSHQYFLFGRNAWQSFQIGAAVYGDLAPKNIPLKYYLTVYNGNNRNQRQDDDNHKNYSLRLEYIPTPIAQVGINTAVTRRYGQAARAYGIDLKIKYPIQKTLEIDGHMEYKRGTNFLAYQEALDVGRITRHFPLKEVEMEGIYSLIRIKKYLQHPYLKAIELSVRQEYLESNTLIYGDILRSHIPMVSLVLAGDYDAKISLVGVFNDYQTNIANTEQYDSNRALIQFQVAF